MGDRDGPTHIERVYLDYQINNSNPIVSQDGPTHLEMIHVWTTHPKPMDDRDDPTHIERVYLDSKITHYNTTVSQDDPTHIETINLDYTTYYTSPMEDRDVVPKRCQTHD